jgi:hypothetical protein
MPNHYVFYHAYDQALGLLFDMQQELREWLTLNAAPSVALRLSSHIKHATLNDFIYDIEEHFSKNPTRNSKVLEDGDLRGAWNPWDNYVSFTNEFGEIHKISDLMISTNPALFSSTGRPATGSFYYFIASQGSLKMRDVLNGFFEGWGFNKKYMGKLVALRSHFLKAEKAGSLLQMFIPKTVVDQVAYLSHPWGTPYRQKLAASFSPEYHRHLKISDVLDLFVHNPFVLGKEVMNALEARIVFMPILFDPTNGIVHIQYDFISKEHKATYYKQFKKIVLDMVTEWVATEAYEALAAKDANVPLVRLLREINKGTAFRAGQP